MWDPQPGAQTSFLLADWCDEIFFGGERGGGKSDAQCGYQEDGALRYRDKWRGIMFRKTYPELEELQARASEIFPGEGAVYKSQSSAEHPFSNCWYWPSGATVKMRYIETEKDYGRYHGHQYCVAVGTPVLMADGRWVRIEEIRTGDQVMTLEGAKKVRAVVAPYIAPCVRLTTNRGSQVQPVWHPVLTNVEEVCGSRRDEFQTVARPQPLSDPWQSAESLVGVFRTNQGFGACREDGQTDFGASADALRESLRLHSYSVQVMLAVPDLLSDRSRIATERCGQGKSDELCSALCRSGTPLMQMDLRRQQEPAGQAADHEGIERLGVPCARVSCDAAGTAKAPGFLGGCRSGHHSYDAQLPAAEESGQWNAQQPACVEALARGQTPADEKGCTPEYILRGLYRYTHPYTREPRKASFPVELGIAQIEWFGNAFVCDLTIEDANHYITACGVINKNTGISFDEVTEYHTPSGLLKMLSTLRSAFGVPCTMRATGNPGGVGHGWVKQRYIENVPPYHPFKDPDTGFIRMFIPSRTSDNQILLRADPHYQQRIRAATGGNEVLRKAWLEGDWNIVAGAFFSEWNSSRHVIKPFSIPIHWTRYRAFDWGSAKPFACYWIAVSDGSMPAFPRGALIVYREYYGMQSGHPNVGLKMTADAVAREIIRMDGKETTHDTGWGVADPAIFTEDGGPSIAEMMRREGLRWRRADNKRRPGWEQMRIRLSCDDDGLPLLVIFDTCVHLIRTLPTLQHDDHNPEDIDTDQEDHAGDALRYGVMARPIIRSERPKEDGPRPGTAEHMMMITDAPKEISKYRSIRRK